jgi:hypothetical protein
MGHSLANLTLAFVLRLAVGWTPPAKTAEFAITQNSLLLWQQTGLQELMLNLGSCFEPFGVYKGRLARLKFDLGNFRKTSRYLNDSLDVSNGSRLLRA